MSEQFGHSPDSPYTSSSPLHSASLRSDSTAAGRAVQHHQQHQVSTVYLHGVPIASLHIDGQERLCLAQISSTLLKTYSYNEIHNRRVALGITCVQCTPVQLELLRRAGAMPVSSRRCGMITRREAERLVKSFLDDIAPPRLPDDFAFELLHSCGWGCRGSFQAARYNSSRAKCIRCAYCQIYFSPNKFIFHCHRPESAGETGPPNGVYRHPDAANFNAWRRHLFLADPNPSEDLVHAWEDVKAMFNGGNRKRTLVGGGSLSIKNKGKDEPSTAEGTFHDNQTKKTRKSSSGVREEDSKGLIGGRCQSYSKNNATLYHPHQHPNWSDVNWFLTPHLNEQVTEQRILQSRHNEDSGLTPAPTAATPWMTSDLMGMHPSWHHLLYSQQLALLQEGRAGGGGANFHVTMGNPCQSARQNLLLQPNSPAYIQGSGVMTPTSLFSLFQSTLGSTLSEMSTICSSSMNSQAAADKAHALSSEVGPSKPIRKKSYSIESIIKDKS